MTILLFGSTGRSGLPLVAQALEAGHAVTAFARDRTKLPSDLREKYAESLTLVEGDILQAAEVDAAFLAAKPDAVVSTLGPAKDSPDDLMSTAASHIIAAMRTHGVRRIIWMTGAGVPGEGDQPKLINHVIKALLKLLAGKVLAQSEAAVNEIRSTELDWTVLRVPILRDGKPTGGYRVGSVGVGTGPKLLRADGATFILRELEQPEHPRRSPVVSN